MVPISPTPSPDRLVSLLARFDPPARNPPLLLPFVKHRCKFIQEPLLIFKIMLPWLTVDELTFTRIAFLVYPIRRTPADTIVPLLKKIAWSRDDVGLAPFAKTTCIFNQLIPVQTPRRILSATIPLEDVPQDRRT